MKIDFQLFIPYCILFIGIIVICIGFLLDQSFKLIILGVFINGIAVGDLLSVTKHILKIQN